MAAGVSRRRAAEAGKARAAHEASRSMKSAAEIAASYLAGRLSVFDAANQLRIHVDPRSALWKGLKGANGPLSVIHIVFDVADQLGFFVPKEVRWEREAFKSRQAQLIEAELRFAPEFRTACQAIIDYKTNSD
jgi:hypothetical protein